MRNSYPFEEKNKASVEKNVKNLYELHEEVNKLLYNFSAEINDYMGTFYRDLHRLKDGEKLEFKDSCLKIEILYNKNGKSKIEISEV